MRVPIPLHFGEMAETEIKAALEKPEPASSCNAEGEKANKVAYVILKKYQRQDDDYDRDTDHGRSQDARFNKP